MVTMMLAILLGIAAIWQANMPLPAANASQMGPLSCKCCDSERSNCRALCCEKPGNSPAPSAPQSLPSTSLNQWSGLPASGSALWILPSFAANEQALPSLLLVAAGTVPIFQRNCSFLL